MALSLFQTKKNPYLDVSNITFPNVNLNNNKQTNQTLTNPNQQQFSNISNSGLKTTQFGASSSPSGYIGVSSPYIAKSTQQTQTTKAPVSYLNQKSNSVSYLNQAPKTQAPANTAPTTSTNSLLEQQKQRLFERSKQSSDLTGQMYDLANQQLRNQIPTLQGAYSEFEKNTNQSIADQTAQADRTKQSVEQNFGQAQKQGAMTRNESEGRLRGQYANNNAIDSYGYGSYRAASSQLEADFNTFTQQNIQDKTNKIADIDNELLSFTNEAKSVLNQSKLQLDQQIANIEAQTQMNDVEKQQAIMQVQDAYQSQVDEIDNYIQSLALQKQQLTESMQFDYQLFNSLSPTFKQTGQPSTQEDLYFIKNSPDAYEKIFGTYADRQKNSTNNGTATTNILSVIDDLLGTNTDAITGFKDVRSYIPGSSVQLTKNLYDQLKGMLSLENRQSLKGSGAISDYEAKVLEQAASALNTNLSNNDFKLILQNLKDQLANGSRSTLGNTQDNKLQQMASILNQNKGSW